MIIPSSFTLAGNRWKVRFVPKKELILDGAFVWGLCVPETQTILLYKRLLKARQQQIFIHEAAHAVLFTMGHMEHDEVMIEAIAQLVYQLITTGESDDTT